MKNRILSDTLKSRLSTDQARIIVLTGARQTGKTTLVRQVFPGYHYLSIEDPVMRIQYSGMTASQWWETYPEAILDEVQKQSSLIESIKSTYDQYSDARYVLTGSSQLLLLKQVKESLAGRCTILELYPLTLPELLTNDWGEPIKNSLFIELLRGRKLKLPASFLLHQDHARRSSILGQYIKFGGYPAVSDKSFSDEKRYIWLSDYIRTYLERDIRDLAEIRNLEPFVKIQQMSALLTGQTINFNKLASEAGVTIPTAQRFIEYLQISYQVILLQPWAKNKRKRLVKSPKLHYLDPGIQNSILQKRGGMTGFEFESLVIGEIYKQMKSAGLPFRLYHLRTFDGMETDLIVETDKGYYAFEIKMSSNIKKSDASNLKRLDSILDKKTIGRFILSNDPQVKEFEGGVLAVPIGLFLM